MNGLHRLAPAKNAFRRALFCRRQFVSFLCHTNVFTRDNNGNNRSRQTTFRLIGSNTRCLVVCLVRAMFISVRNFRNGLYSFHVSAPQAFRLNGVTCAPRRYVNGAQYTATTTHGLNNDPCKTERVRSTKQAASGTTRRVVVMVFRVRISARANARQDYRRATAHNDSRRHREVRVGLCTSNEETFICRSICTMILRN